MNIKSDIFEYGGISLIYFDNVSKMYEKNGVYALSDINLIIEDYEFVFLIGQSGAGKSTLIKLLQSELIPTNGKLVVNNIDTSTLSSRKLPMYRRKIGMVFQDFRLLNNKTVYENVAFAMEILGKSSSVIKKNVPYALNLVGLENKAKSYPNQLSGGEQQRVSIARAIVNRPPVLIADEPTGNLDIQNSIQIMSLLDTINKQGTTVIVATHDKDIVNRMKKRVIKIENGKIASDIKKGRYENE